MNWSTTDKKEHQKCGSVEKCEKEEASEMIGAFGEH